jgi:hypothetical protein
MPKKDQQYLFLSLQEFVFLYIQRSHNQPVIFEIPKYAFLGFSPFDITGLSPPEDDPNGGL